MKSLNNFKIAVKHKNINFLDQQKLDLGRNKSLLKKDILYYRWLKQTDKNKSKRLLENYPTEIV